MDQRLTNYLTSLLPPKEDWVSQMEEQAKEESIPIMDPVSINFMMQLIRLLKPNRILEIGTAIGYSALRMVEANPSTSIVTIEKNEERYVHALENIKEQKKEERITVIHGDALEELSEMTKYNQRFDLVFIDAAKGQYKHFFELANPLLVNDGIIISDNVLFRGHVVNPENAHARHKKMVEKIRNYNDWLANHPEFLTSIVPIGDGIAISLKKE
ncbi:O-methyltransferase [Virgibacillus ainsalahensis]